MIKVLLFGTLAEKAGQDHFEISGDKTVGEILDEVYEKSEAIKAVNFKVSVNMVMVSDKEKKVREGDEVALLPPFSGG